MAGYDSLIVQAGKEAELAGLPDSGSVYLRSGGYRRKIGLLRGVPVRQFPAYRRFILYFKGLMICVCVGALVFMSTGTGWAENPPSGMVLVPAGWFRMGSDKSEINRAMYIFQQDEGIPAVESWFEDETPKHKVFINSFYIDIHEVNNKEYKRFVEAGGYKNKKYWTEKGWGWVKKKKVTRPDCWSNNNFNHPGQPVVCVSWYEASAYAKWAGKRLPTESEWEKAARGDDDRLYPWGSDPPKKNDAYLANYHPGENQEADGYKYTAPVDSFSEGKSPYGAMNMSGNVWVWCKDWYGEKYYSVSSKKNPRGPEKGNKKIVRGGAWLNFSVSIRSAYRSYVDPKLRYSHIGIRCVRDAS